MPQARGALGDMTPRWCPEWGPGTEKGQVKTEETGTKNGALLTVMYNIGSFLVTRVLFPCKMLTIKGRRA